MVAVPEDVLNDVFSRFILPEAKNNSDPIRLCFAIEMAHWFYLDYIRPIIPNLPDSTVEAFAKTCFKYMPSLLKPYQEANVILKQWREFKRRVPVYGAMLITPDKTKALMVEGNSTRGCWTFPRGKIEENEDPFDCACREVKEETSFDIRDYADRSFFIEKVCSDRRVRLYVVHGVPETTLFYTKVRGEIANYHWFVIDDLPGGPGFSQSKRKKEQFFMVNQFVREYIKSCRQGKQRNTSESDKNRRPRGSSFADGISSKRDQQNAARKDSYNDYRDNHRDKYNERDNHQEKHRNSDNRRDSHRDNDRDNRRDRDNHDDAAHPPHRELAASTSRSMTTSLSGNYPVHHPNYLPQQYKMGKSSSAQQRNYGAHSLNGGAQPLPGGAQDIPDKRHKKGFVSSRGGRGRRFNPPRMSRRAHQTLASFELDIKSLMLCLPDQVSVSSRDG